MKFGLFLDYHAIGHHIKSSIIFWKADWLSDMYDGKVQLKAINQSFYINLGILGPAFNT